AVAVADVPEPLRGGGAPVPVRGPSALAASRAARVSGVLRRGADGAAVLPDRPRLAQRQPAGGRHDHAIGAVVHERRGFPDLAGDGHAELADPGGVRADPGGPGVAVRAAAEWGERLSEGGTPMMLSIGLAAALAIQPVVPAVRAKVEADLAERAR